MTKKDDFNINCPIPITDYPEIVLAHGGGGSLTQSLIEKLFLPTFDNSILNQQHDGGVFEINGVRLAMSTDSYVVRPSFFPGGDIGMLAVNGTLNDLAMCGAKPLYMSAGLILEEGFSMNDLWKIITSMKQAASKNNIQLITGDTKVVDKGSGDGIYINTTGIGMIKDGIDISPAKVCDGDVIIVSGDIGRHGMAIMSVRKGLDFETTIKSDTAALTDVVETLINENIEIHCLRDPTRGGLATTLIEIAETSNLEMKLEEALIPVSDQVSGACEVLGFDPLYVANEGRFIVIVPEKEAELTLEVLRSNSLCQQACIIGTVSRGQVGTVISKTQIGGQRILDRLSGDQLPRIC